MWESYKRTFRSMQALMVLVSFVIYSRTHAWTTAAAFFITMQVGAVVGAWAGHRWKNRRRHAGNAAPQVDIDQGEVRS